MDLAGLVHVWPAEADQPTHIVDWVPSGLTCDCESMTACPHRARAWAEYEQLWRELVAISRSHGLIAAVRFAVYDQSGQISSQPIRPVRDVLLWRDRDGAHANILLLQRHSTTVDWGYVGAGPTELARSVLTHFYGPATAIALYREFMREVIANIPYSVDEYVLDAETIHRWVEAKAAFENGKEVES